MAACRGNRRLVVGCGDFAIWFGDFRSKPGGCGIKVVHLGLQWQLMGDVDGCWNERAQDKNRETARCVGFLAGLREKIVFYSKKMTNTAFTNTNNGSKI
ncbi:MAG: hypothetical protein IJC88_06545 [Oscillospiraceae bacterium]|nr:hypothetical protein [Oscillospiraceae bacterium]